MKGERYQFLTLCYLIRVYSSNNQSNFYLDSLSFVNRFFISILFYLGQKFSIFTKLKFVRMATNLAAAIDFELANLNKDYIESKPASSFFGRDPKNMSIYDYLIIGSGPGATQAFETLKQSNSIAVIEREGYLELP